MRPALFDDEALRTRLRAETAVAAMRQALLHAEDGALAAPPRVSADLGPGRMVFTVGALAGRWFGYRSYDTFPASPGAQVVVLHDWDDGQVKAIAAGNELGPRRTGAIGAVAVDVLAQPGASRLAVIGTGAQAWTQVWAVRAVRDLDQVLVYSRDPANRAAFAARARDQLGVAATEAPSARDAVRDATIVVLATSSGSPVISPDWLSPGCHVTTLGPKVTGRAEISPDLAAGAAVIATDSLAQVHAYQPPFILAGTPHLDRMVSLGSIIMGTHAGRGSPDDITLFCSAGLAGTEVHLLAALTDGAV